MKDLTNIPTPIKEMRLLEGHQECDGADELDTILSELRDKT
jgi:hypothetical protein